MTDLTSTMSNHPLRKVEVSQLSIAERIQVAEGLWDSILDKTDRRLEQHRQDPGAACTWEAVKQRLGAQFF
jgi:putative addiction module component (TIGR02574 family)